MTNVIDILIDAKDNASATIKRIWASVQESQISFAKMAVAGGIAFGALTGVIMKSVSAANESERAHAQLEAALKSTWGAVGLTSREIEKQSKDLERQLGIQDEVIGSAQNMLLTFTNIGKGAFPTATKAVIDMATAMNWGATPAAEQLRDTSIQVGKALNDPIKWITALHRVGVEFSDQQKELIATMVWVGDTAGAQKVILDELAKEFGGSALAQSETFEGSMRKLHVTIENMFETIGTALIPILTKLATAIAPIINKIADWITLHPQLTIGIIWVATALSGLVLIIGTVWVVLPAVTAWLEALGLTIAGIFWPVTIVIGAITLLAVAWENNFWHIQEKTKTAFDFISDVFHSFSALFHGDVEKFWEGLVITIEHLFQNIKKYFPDFYDAFSKVWTDIEDITVKILTRIGKFVIDRVNDIKNALQAMKDTFAEIVTLWNANTQTYNWVPVAWAKANWGFVNSGSTYIVGERGPELFTPSSSGNITPNNQLGGGVNVSINFGGVSVRNDNDINAMTSMITDELTRKLQLYKLGVA